MGAHISTGRKVEGWIIDELEVPFEHYALAELQDQTWRGCRRPLLLTWGKLQRTDLDTCYLIVNAQLHMS